MRIDVGIDIDLGIDIGIDTLIRRDEIWEDIVVYIRNTSVTR